MIRRKLIRRSQHHFISDINVTPLVDVMLVLLIIFMIASPMLVSGVTVDLPETKSIPIAGQDQPLVVSLNKDGEIYIIDTQINKADLNTKLSSIVNEKKDTRIFVRGDKNVAYGKVVELVAEIHSAGFSKVALISNIKDNDRK